MDKLQEILGEIRPDIDFINEKNLINDGVLDSFDIIQVVIALNEAYNIDINVEDLEPDNFNTADAMLQLVEKLQEG